MVLLAILLASGTSAYLDVRRGQPAAAERIGPCGRDALATPPYPLSESVLATIRGLSGTEFIVFDADGQLRESTLRLGPDELDQVRRLPAEVLPQP